MKDTSQFCKCTNCEEVFFDTNGGQQPELKIPEGKSFRETTTQLEFDMDEDNEYFIGCPTCQTDGFLMDVEDEKEL